MPSASPPSNLVIPASLRNSSNRLFRAFRFCKQCNGLLTLSLTAAILVTLVTYSQVVEQKTHLQNVIEKTQRLNEENNSLHVQLNQAQSYQDVLQRQETRHPHLNAPSRVLALSSISKPLQQPVATTATLLPLQDDAHQMGNTPRLAPLAIGY